VVLVTTISNRRAPPAAPSSTEAPSSPAKPDPAPQPARASAEGAGWSPKASRANADRADLRATLPDWYPKNWDMQAAARGAADILKAQGKPPDLTKPAKELIFSDADLTLIKATVGMRLRDADGNLVMNPDTGKPIVMLSGGGAKNGDDLEALKRNHPELPWATFKEDHAQYDSPEAILSSKPIPETLNKLREEQRKDGTKEFVITARWDQKVVGGMDQYMKKQGVKLDGVFVALNDEQSKALGFTPELTTPQRKAMAMAALITLHDPKAAKVHKVTFMEDNDANLSASMQLLPKLFPKVKFEFDDVVHTGGGHFERRVVAKSDEKSSALLTASGKPMTADAIAHYSSTAQDVRFDPSAKTPASSAKALAGAGNLDDLREHGKSVGYPFPLVSSPWSVFLKTGPEKEGKIPDTDKTVQLLDVKALQKAGSKVIPWTVNTKDEMVKLLNAGVDGIISDDPQLLRKTVEEYSKLHHLGFIGSDGLIDDTKFSAQAHRGGRALRPENTLPSMEVGLDNLCSTLETDVGITKDGVPVLSHENFVAAKNARRTDGSAYDDAHEIHIKDLTLEQIQKGFVLDKLLPDRPLQKNDRALSPVAVAYAKARGMNDAYQMPTVDQLFDFTKFYADYYKNGAGKNEPDAERRWKNAQRVHFNIETKVLPETEAKGEVIPVLPFTRTLADTIERNGMAGRADIQSFDARSIRIVEDEYKNLPAVFLFEN
jgi:glycerophosphoryl diester phosphodiesterase